MRRGVAGIGLGEVMFLWLCGGGALVKDKDRLGLLVLACGDRRLVFLRKVVVDVGVLLLLDDGP